MISNYNILIQATRDTAVFIQDWKSVYRPWKPEYYYNNIGNALASWNGFHELFLWKNGTNKLSARKLQTVEEYWEKRDLLKKYKKEGVSAEERFVDSFKPNESATIWKAFLAHIVRPGIIPLFDQHVYRAYHFFHRGEIEEISEDPAEKWDHFNEYRRWVIQIKDNYDLELKDIDEAFFAFGSFLKRLKTLPIEITT